MIQPRTQTEFQQKLAGGASFILRNKPQGTQPTMQLKPKAEAGQRIYQLYADGRLITSQLVFICTGFIHKLDLAGQATKIEDLYFNELEFNE